MAPDSPWAWAASGDCPPPTPYTVPRACSALASGRGLGWQHGGLSLLLTGGHSCLLRSCLSRWRLCPWSHQLLAVSMSPQLGTSTPGLTGWGQRLVARVCPGEEGGLLKSDLMFPIPLWQHTIPESIPSLHDLPCGASPGCLGAGPGLSSGASAPGAAQGLWDL